MQELFDDVDAIAPSWRSALRSYNQAVHHQAVARRAADRRLRTVLAGMGLQRWRNLVFGRAHIFTSRDGLDIIKARRIRSDVESALARLAEVKTAEAVCVAAAERELGIVAGRLLPYGQLAVAATDFSTAEMQRLATVYSRPPRPNPGCATPPA